MNRLGHTFARLKSCGRRAFIPFVTAGDPDLTITESLLLELAAAGADIIELGLPFSDPVADGEVIQRASERALRNGVTVQAAVACVESVRRQIDLPIVLFSYFNPLLQFGIEQLAVEAKRVGLDAILVTDLIPEEAEQWTRTLRQHAVDPIFLVAPTTSDARLVHIAQRASGFIYAIARAGVTGDRADMTLDAQKLVQRLRAITDLPIAVGFGISRPEHVRQVWEFADAAVIGSAIVREIERCIGQPELVQNVGRFVRLLLEGRESSSSLRSRAVPDALLQS